MIRRRPWLAVGALALVLAVVVAVAPVPEQFLRIPTAAVASAVVTALAVLVGLVGLTGLFSTDWLWRSLPWVSAHGTGDGEGATVGPGPVSDGTGDRSVAGESIDESLARLSAPKRRETWAINDDRWRVRKRVRAAAIAVQVECEGLSPETAEARLADGSWTDDPRAAAFLGDVTLPVTVRVRDWLSGRGFERRARAAVAAVADRADVETVVTEA